MSSDTRTVVTSREIPSHCSPVMDCVFKAISDPTRRHLLEQLRASAMTVNQMADHLPISRPAVSQHLRALREAQLVTVQTSGTRRVYMFNDAGFRHLQAWIETFSIRQNPGGGTEPVR